MKIIRIEQEEAYIQKAQNVTIEELCENLECLKYNTQGSDRVREEGEHCKELRGCFQYDPEL